MPYHFALAMNNSLKPGELSEIITHLAFYSGWANAMVGAHLRCPLSLCFLIQWK
jgi:4-carboxymuconolactone decarboxylase